MYIYIYGKLYIIIHGEINEHICNKRGMNIKESKKGYMLFKLKKGKGNLCNYVSM